LAKAVNTMAVTLGPKRTTPIIAKISFPVAAASATIAEITTPTATKKITISLLDVRPATGAIVLELILIPLWNESNCDAIVVD